ncbi:MAG: cation transporter [Acidimicrobiales bacterium]
MTAEPAEPAGDGRPSLLRRGLRLEYTTLGWNVVGVVVTAVGAISAGSIALAGFGFDSLIEIGASVVVVWELRGAPEQRERRAMRLIGAAFCVLVVYLSGLVIYTFVTGGRPRQSFLGITWTALTLAAMLALAAGKARTGKALDNPVLRTEGRVTLVDAYLAGAVLAGLLLNAALGWWWADPLAGLVIVYYGAREAREALTRH